MTGPSASDAEVDEALALVNEGRKGRGSIPHATAAAGTAAGWMAGTAAGPTTSPATGPTAGHAAGPLSAPQGAGPNAPGEKRHRDSTPWDVARARATRAARTPEGATASVPLAQALGKVLAAPLTALTDLPSFDTSAMDGWAVAGPGPWDVRAEGVLAGDGEPAPLGDGEAVRIATGAGIPRDATAVLRSEHGRTDDKGRLYALRDLVQGQDVRPRGQECRTGDHLLPAGSLVTPAVLGLAAAAGYDTLATVRRPRVDVLVLGDELLTEGLPREGLIRDALGPMLPSWLRALGAEVTKVRRLGDDAKALREAIRKSSADVIVTTGGTASGPVDHVHPTLSRIGAELLVDGVAVRPGHPMLLARVKEDQHLVGLPGNPLAAVSGLLTLAEPLLRTLSGRASGQGGPPMYTAPVCEAVHGHPYDTRLVPVTLRGEVAVPLRFHGPAMLRGIAAADGLAVVPSGGARQGQELEILDLPWAVSGDLGGECFT
ncbi:molybdopterin molybdenumtransferase MoeA [Streptomyces alfalfae]|uniref:Molybdopterin molybdenumtransferase n=1 Tax=Streptomyces alfalfae TaxID=1642299 RepID=A0ABM6GTA1_9ACTN|nr:molybdopterin molybdotransferase MoeA [Streptomyces alfalfae]AYA17721.1 molybdopterin molybdenumtransferase MoeA [Streptomyces fradiae]APY87313.1 molybdopterin molybdenumtransferase MoeA [Streptomyces alfalfae]QUI32860.1 molybdopterin molybdotransferase MoeA [Streptomyces alfalfae]RXX44932.1 molybdopterin molybdenumtransferase MoeA [Streptomyces alfalfae]RZM92412.1 molybdopterin molybdenumtransferase MoeA [Streptomyces alfalfae]